MSFLQILRQRLSGNESRVLYLAMLTMGASGLAFEYTLSKISGDILGNSVQQWAVIIGVMMFFMGIGSDVQKYVAEKNLFDAFVFLETVLALAGALGPIVFIYIYGLFPFHFVLVQYFFIIAIGLIIGMEVPLVSRLNARFLPELRLNLAAVLKMDYIGALLGALAWIFLLVPNYELSRVAFLIAFFNWGVALISLYFFRRQVVRGRLLAAVNLLVGLTLVVGFFNVDRWRIDAEQYLYRDRIVYSHTTPYQHIVLTEGRNGDISCYINGHLQFYSGDEFIYHENLVHTVMNAAPVHANVLILGGGDGLALREVLKYKDVRRVTLCDLDPQMTQLAAENPFFRGLNRDALNDNERVKVVEAAVSPGESYTVFSKNDKYLWRGGYDSVATVHVVNMDAARFVERISGMYDVIIVDFPDPNAPDLAKLYSKTFYEHLRKKLSRDGLMIQQSTSPYHAREVFLSIGKTMRDAGLSTVPLRDNVPSFGEWGWWIAGRAENYSPGRIKKALRGIKNIAVETRYLTAPLIRANLVFPRDALNDDDIRVNTLGNSVIYHYYLNAWQNE